MQFRAGRYRLRYPGSPQFDGPAISQSGRSALHGESRVSWCVQWLAEQLIERHAPRIVQHEYGAGPVTSSFDRSSRPGRIQLFSQRIFVLQSFQSFRRGILRRWRKYQNLGVAVLTCGTIKVKVLVRPQRLKNIFLELNHRQTPAIRNLHDSFPDQPPKDKRTYD